MYSAEIRSNPLFTETELLPVRTPDAGDAAARAGALNCRREVHHQAEEEGLSQHRSLGDFELHLLVLGEAVPVQHALLPPPR